ncbi:MAG TPA: NAD-dependent epimerase/dehydratase family protein [Acidimicrobiales bacterium]|nr:NAD-dependent epimerase/dehydratase family protein [Acidimicrobiales bacterium]
MRVAVLGADGAVGAAVVQALLDDPRHRVDDVVGLDRRLPLDPQPGVDWRELGDTADDPTGDLAGYLHGVDAVVNVLSPAPRGVPRQAAPAVPQAEDVLLGHVLDEVAAAGVRHLVQGSTFAVYSPAGEGHDPVDESWPTDGVADVPLVRRAVAVERTLDEFSAAHPVIRVVRLRSGLVLGPRALAAFLRRLGPLAAYYRAPGRFPVLPGIEGALPVVHHDDLAAAVCAAVTGSATGAFNIAMDAPLDLRHAASALGARPLAVPSELVRLGTEMAGAILAVTRRDGDRTPGAWLAIARHAPRLATWRARQELGWFPVHPLDDALRSTIAGRP